MSKSLTDTMDSLIENGKASLSEIKSILDELQQMTTDIDESTDEDKILAIQLILQYRLSSEDALNVLLRMDQHLLAALGIQPQHSDRLNRERLAYAVGNEDFKQILNVLAQLTGLLSKIIARNKNSHFSLALKDKTPQKQHTMVRNFSKLLAKQKQCVDVFIKLELTMEEYLQRQSEHPIFDHIAALRGPISQFHEAIIHGLGQAEEYYHLVNKTPLIDHQLNALLKQTEQVLHLMPSIYNPHPHHPLKQFDHSMTSEQLEQRATTKRLRPFFG